MNIIMISIDYPPIVGGISAHVYELSKAMAEEGHNVSVFTRKLANREKRKTKESGVGICEFDLKIVGFLYGLQINKFTADRLCEIKPDIIHIHGMRPLEGYRIKNIPLVYTNHTSGYLKRIEKRGLRRMALLKRLFKKPQLILAPSNELLEIPFHISAKKKMITNGVDSEKYKFNQKTRKEIRKELGISDDVKLGIVTRRLVEKNGVIYLAKASEYIKDKNCRFLLIGDGEEREKIASEFEKHFSGRFIMTGAKSHNEIIPYYSAADFSILPSLAEATSISGLEAMAASLPLVGTDTGGIPDIIENGKTGLLCKKGDEYDLARKINMLLSCDYKRLGENGKIAVLEKFDWKIIAKQTIEAYADINKC